MPKTRQQKEIIKETLVQNFKQSPSVVFADYQGLNVPQADELRKKMFDNQIKYMVAKKTLINLATKEAGIEFNAKDLPGMIGIAFAAEDEIAPAKILGDVAKDTSLKLVGGIFAGAAVDQNYVITLSKLPGRDQLYGMFLSVINGPISGFVRALDAIRKQKEEGTPAPAPDSPSPEATESKGSEAEVATAPAEEKPAEAPAETTEAPAATPSATPTPADSPAPETAESAETPKE